MAQDHLMKKASTALDQKTPKLLNIYSVMIIGLIIGAIISYFNIGPKIDYKTAFLMWGFMVSIFVIAFKLYKKSLKRLPSDKGIILGKHTFVLDDEGIKEETEQSSSTLKWSGVQEVEETEDMIYVYVDNVSAHFIPKHFFVNEEEVNDFKMVILDKCKNIKSHT